MKKKLFVLFAAIIMLASVVLSAPVNYGSQPRFHIVSPGDCLWKLANYYLGNPYKWPEIWEANRNIISNPHWIYPGQRLLFPATGPTYIPPELLEDPTSIEIASVNIAEPVVSIDMAIRCGYITNNPIANPVYIVSNVDPDINVLTIGLELYIDGGENNGLYENQLLLVYNNNREISHPITGENLGKVIQPEGIIKITEVHPNTSRCLVTKNFSDSLCIGDLVTAYTIPEIPTNIKILKTDYHIEGKIIDFFDNLGITKPYSFTFIDLGRNHSIEVGDIFEIVRTGEIVSNPVDGHAITLPEIVVGYIQILNVQNETSTGYVINTTNRIDVQKGEKVRLLGRSNPTPVQAVFDI